MTGVRTPHPPLPRWQRRALAALWCAGGVAASLAFVRVAVGWVFPVASGSMWPTLHRGEWVFLRWGREVPKRFDIVVFRSESGDALVKRTWGLPNERVLVEPSGDVRIGTELVRGEGRPGRVTVYDSRRLPVEGHWNHGGSAVDPWRKVEGDGAGEVWEVDSRAVAPRLAASLLRHHKGVHDDHLAPDGTVVYGKTTVHDLALSVAVFVAAVAEPTAAGDVPRLRFELVEQGDRIEFSLELPSATGPATGRIGRRRPDGGVEHTKATFDVPVGRWFQVSFSNIDDELVATVDGQPPLTYRYERNTPHRLDLDNDGEVDAPVESFGERALLGADLAQVRFKDLVLERDIHVPAAGNFAVGRELTLGPDEVFVLGDDPTNSEDSRKLGPISTARIVGHPTFVVWPPSAWRRIGR